MYAVILSNVLICVCLMNMNKLNIKKETHIKNEEVGWLAILHILFTLYDSWHVFICSKS